MFAVSAKLPCVLFLNAFSLPDSKMSLSLKGLPDLKLLASLAYCSCSCLMNTRGMLP